jgi:hypothetical protein
MSMNGNHVPAAHDGLVYMMQNQHDMRELQT